MSAKMTIATMIERALRDEDIGLRHPYDRMDFARLEGLVADWQGGGALDEDDRDFLMGIILVSPFPKTRSRPLKDEEEQERFAGARKRALQRGRAYRKNLLREHPEILPDEAWNLAAEWLRQRYPSYFMKSATEPMTTKTIVDRLTGGHLPSV
jgi:hypothetical protein